MKNLKTKAVLACAAALLVPVLFQSCKKDNRVSPAPAANINDDDAASFSATPAQLAAGISNGLIAYWPLSGTIYDFSGHNHKGVPYNLQPAADRMNNNGGAFFFNGNNSYVAIKDSAELRLANTDFSMNAWVSAYSFAKAQSIMTKRLAGAGNGWSLNLSPYSGNPSEGFVLAQGGLKSAAGLPLDWTGNWHMVSVTYTLATQKMRIFVDGTLQKIIPGIASPNALADARLYIGADNPAIPGGPTYLNGSLSDIRLYNRAINSKEIQYLYSVPTAPTSDIADYITMSGTANDLANGNIAKGRLLKVKRDTDRFGNPWGASHFSDTINNHALSFGYSTALNASYTINTWVKIDGYGADYSPMLYWENAATTPALNFGIIGQSDAANTGKVLYSVNGGSSSAMSTRTVSLGQWHMITAIYTQANSTVKIYIDGALDNTFHGMAAPASVESEGFAVGAALYNSPVPVALNGSLNDIRVFTRELTKAEITNLYKALD